MPAFPVELASISLYTANVSLKNLSWFTFGSSNIVVVCSICNLATCNGVSWFGSWPVLVEEIWMNCFKRTLTFWLNLSTCCFLVLIFALHLLFPPFSDSLLLLHALFLLHYCLSDLYIWGQSSFCVFIHCFNYQIVYTNSTSILKTNSLTLYLNNFQCLLFTYNDTTQIILHYMYWNDYKFSLTLN